MAATARSRAAITCTRGLLRKTPSWTHPSNHIGHGQRSDEFAFERGTAMGPGVGLEKSGFVFDLVTGLARGNRGARYSAGFGAGDPFARQAVTFSFQIPVNGGSTHREQLNTIPWIVTGSAKGQLLVGL